MSRDFSSRGGPFTTTQRSNMCIRYSREDGSNVHGVEKPRNPDLMLLPTHPGAQNTTRV